jgi:hypothetical protein
MLKSENTCKQTALSKAVDTWTQYTASFRVQKNFVYFVAVITKGKGKAVSLQALSGPEGSRKLRFPDFMTTAQDGGKFVSLTHRPPLPPGDAPGTHFC